MSESDEKRSTPARRVTPDQIERIYRNAEGDLALKVRGDEAPLEGVKARRCLPWSDPERYIALLDKEGKEIALLHSLDELEPASRALIEAELHAKLFSPKISRILEQKDEFEVIAVTAETDRGKVTFELRTRDDVAVLAPNQILFRDADGIAYEIRDARQLDRRTQAWLEEFL
jgi:hypothetical protein